MKGSIDASPIGIFTFWRMYLIKRRRKLIRLVSSRFKTSMIAYRKNSNNRCIVLTTTVVHMIEGDSSTKNGNMSRLDFKCFFSIWRWLSLKMGFCWIVGMWGSWNGSYRPWKMLSFLWRTLSEFDGWSGWLGGGRNQTRLGTSSTKSVKCCRVKFYNNYIDIKF